MDINLKQQIYIYTLFALSIVALVVLAACALSSYTQNAPIQQSLISDYVDEVQDNLALMRQTAREKPLDKSKHPPIEKIKCGSEDCSLF